MGLGNIAYQTMKYGKLSQTTLVCSRTQKQMTHFKWKWGKVRLELLDWESLWISKHRDLEYGLVAQIWTESLQTQCAIAGQLAIPEIAQRVTALATAKRVALGFARVYSRFMVN